MHAFETSAAKVCGNGGGKERESEIQNKLFLFKSAGGVRHFALAMSQTRAATTISRQRPPHRAPKPKFASISMWNTMKSSQWCTHTLGEVSKGKEGEGGGPEALENKTYL